MANSDPKQMKMYCAPEVGKQRRLSNIFNRESGKTLIVPMDDSLIFGPTAGLENVNEKLSLITSTSPDALLAFPGVFQSNADSLKRIALIVNLTASTKRSLHTQKFQVGTVSQAMQLGADAVAVHTNVTSQFEGEMLRILGNSAIECASSGMPLIAIMYPRSESQNGDNNYEDIKQTDHARYVSLVSHAARIAVDLGADVIKTVYTGNVDSFRTVVESCSPVPIVIAGGPLLPLKETLDRAYDAIRAGAAGISFGRNIFSRDDPRQILTALKYIVHGRRTPEEAMAEVEKEIK